MVPRHRCTFPSSGARVISPKSSFAMSAISRCIRFMVVCMAHVSELVATQTGWRVVLTDETVPGAMVYGLEWAKVRDGRWWWLSGETGSGPPGGACRPEIGHHVGANASRRVGTCIILETDRGQNFCSYTMHRLFPLISTTPFCFSSQHEGVPAVCTCTYSLNQRKLAENWCLQPCCHSPEGVGLACRNIQSI